MSLVTPDEVIEQVSPGVSEDTLQSIIDREEKWLARKIGPLTGERVARYDVSRGPLRLPRTTDAVEVAGVDPSLVTLYPDGRTVGISPWPYLAVEVTFTPDDEEEVRQAVIDLCRITLTTSPYSSESSDGHTYSRAYGSVDGYREAVAARLMGTPKTATVSFGG